MKQPIPCLLPILFFLLCCGCKKSPTENHTSKLGGAKVWHGRKWGNSYIRGNIVSYDTSFTDTFAIGIIDKNTISVKGEMLYFWANDGRSIMFRGKNSALPEPSGLFTYYGDGDSMVYLNEFNHASGSAAYRLSTP